MEQSQSPLPKEAVKVEVKMGFGEMCQAVLDGKKATRLEWEGKENYVVMNGGQLSLHKEDGTHQWIISEEDLRATNWEIINEKQ